MSLKKKLIFPMTKYFARKMQKEAVALPNAITICNCLKYYFLKKNNPCPPKSHMTNSLLIRMFTE